MSHNWFWFYLRLCEKVAQVLLANSVRVVSVKLITFHSIERHSNFLVVSFSAVSSEWSVICSHFDVPLVMLYMFLN